MSLDRLTAPGDLRLDSRHNCDRCGDVVPLLIAGLCRYCTTLPTPPQPKGPVMSSQPEPVVGETVMLPEYAVEVAELLAATEGHPDATVRAVRKILTQSAVALRAMVQTSDPAVRTEPAGASLAAAPSAGSEPTAAEYRRWAAANGHNVAPNGRVPAYIKELYANAHQDAA